MEWLLSKRPLLSRAIHLLLGRHTSQPALAGTPQSPSLEGQKDQLESLSLPPGSCVALS